VILIHSTPERRNLSKPPELVPGIQNQTEGGECHSLRDAVAFPTTDNRRLTTALVVYETNPGRLRLYQHWSPRQAL
jgi:hypothetical protein